MEDSTIAQPAAGAATPTHRFLWRTFSSLRHVNYRYLWIGTVCMSAGQWIQQVTLGWLVYDLTGSSVLLGVLNGLRALPFLLVSPIAGVAADRMDRRRLVLTAEWVLMITALGMGLLVASGFLETWHVFAFTLITGVCWAFVDPIRQSMVPMLVPKQELMNAVALNSAAFNMTKVIGPSIGGVLIAAFGVAGNFFVQGVTYAGVVLFVYWMVAPATPLEARRSSALANLKEGLVYVWSNPTIFALMITALVPRIFAMPFQTLMPVFQKDVLKVGPEGLGVLLAAPGLGAMLAGLMLATLSYRIRRQGVLMLVSLVSLGVTMNLFSWTTSFPLAILALVGEGACQIFYMATTNTLLQLIVPDHLRGRVMSIYSLDRGLMPVGSLLAGVMAHFIGAPATVSFMGLTVIVLGILVAWRAPIIRGLGHSAKG
ncbi:MAG: MFS transporter [Deltaproteobacteria bacterium]|nr:MFS transporter [Deltaproteobacteria bacterium]MBI3066409.1 MFS transporter [Deltaproteobacteria bacterium]